MTANVQLADELIAIEKETLAAFKRKDRAAFTRHFATDYVGVANDAIKTADGEVAGMMKVEVSALHMEGERVWFPAEGVAVMTYTMVTRAALDGKDISGSIYTSTVYVQREGAWVAVLHTESIASK